MAVSLTNYDKSAVATSGTGMAPSLVSGLRGLSTELSGLHFQARRHTVMELRRRQRFLTGEAGFVEKTATIEPEEMRASASAPNPETSLIAQEVVVRVRDQLDRGRVSDALDFLYDRLDDLLIDGAFDAAKAVIKAVSSERFPLTVLLSALTITLPWRHALGSARADLVEVTRQKALFDGGEAKLKAVLHGLV